MFYWIIPYLVAYNASNSGDWKYGPEHVFKAEIYANITRSPNHKTAECAEVVIDFACRPMTSRLDMIQCRVDSATVYGYEVAADSDIRRHLKRNKNFNIDKTVFQVEFNEEGISRVWFLNTNSSVTDNIIRAIIGTMNVGISVVGKKFENYVSREKSVIGICDTSFNIRRNLLPEEEEQEETAIEDYHLDVPALRASSDDATIVIEKDRNPSECVKKTLYFFGSTDEDDAIHLKNSNIKMEQLITYSQSRMYLGEKYFSAYTENLGQVIMAFRKQSGTTEIKVGEIIRVSLQSIGPAKEELRNTGDLANVGVGFEPGTSWPEQKTDNKIKFHM